MYIMCSNIKKSNTSTVRTLDSSTIPMAHNKHYLLGLQQNQKYLLVVIDQCSRYPVVEIVSSTPGNCTISGLEKIFSENGLSHRIVSNTGPPFTSNQISTYMKISKITHNRIAPLHPRTNGIVDQQNTMYC